MCNMLKQIQGTLFFFFKTSTVFTQVSFSMYNINLEAFTADFPEIPIKLKTHINTFLYNRKIITYIYLQIRRRIFKNKEVNITGFSAFIENTTITSFPISV